ncbi:hypothetical protein AB4099_10315 [Bosea sp. 2KB_26]|uniref:hypothetical protein n=1 Tax=Bosea sp. 2KB_26 TaxID=3237475 RepID=UPI000DE41463
MWFDPNTRARARIVFACAAAISSSLWIAQARAQEDRYAPPPEATNEAIVQDPRPTGSIGKPTSRQHRREADQRSGQYFVEFRSRYALSYGHTFLVHGRLNARGEVGQVRAEQVAGLHPAGEGPQLWSVGHVLPVPAETGPSDGDLEDEYISARYRVLLTEAQYRRVAAYIRQKQQKPTAWHAVLYNCNRWVGEVAQYMGLKAPDNTLLYPPDYIASLRAINSGRARDDAVPASLQQ